MTLPIAYHPDAGRELHDAVVWSDDQFGQGAALQEAVLRLEAAIAEQPGAKPVARDAPRDRQDVRQALVAGYPYRLVLLIRPRKIVILAFAHLRRRPGYWQPRLE